MAETEIKEWEVHISHGLKEKIEEQLKKEFEKNSYGVQFKQSKYNNPYSKQATEKGNSETLEMIGEQLKKANTIIEEEEITNVIKTTTGFNYYSPEVDFFKVPMPPKYKPPILFKEKGSKNKLYNIGLGYTINIDDLRNFSPAFNIYSIPIILRDLESFKKTIIDLFGTFSEPTLIPAFIGFQFELSPEHYNFEPILIKDDYNIDNYYLGTERRKNLDKNLEGTGYEAILWLIQSNYIPSNYNVISQEQDIQDLMTQKMNDWMKENSYNNNICKPN